MNELWCFDCQNVFDSQQKHYCVDSSHISKTLVGKDAYFSTKLQNNDYESKLPFPGTEEESRCPNSVIYELGNAELDVSTQTDITHLLTNSDIQLLNSTESASEKMNQFMVSNSVENCIEDCANRETDVQAKPLKQPVYRIGDKLPQDSNIRNCRMLVENCGTNVIRSQFSTIENSSMLNSENNNLNFIISNMNIDSLMFNKPESECSSKEHQHIFNVKTDNLISRYLDALSDEGKLNTDFGTNITLPNKEMVSKVVQMSEMSRQFSVSGYSVNDNNQNSDLENMSCPINIKENSIYQHLKSDNMFTVEETKSCVLDGSLASHENDLTFGKKIYQGDQEEIANTEFVNHHTTALIQPCFADGNAVIRPSCSQDSERTCPICRKEFRTKKILKQHYQMHSDEKNFTCRICKQKFSFKYNLSRHEREVHMGEKSHKCEICKNIFSRKNDLEKHLQSHTNYKPFKCDNCGKLFTRKGVLDIHMRTHTGEKPYTCDICSSTFAQKPHLIYHVKTWHEVT